MRTVYLIGNGFDVNLGLPTKYIDFYNHYLGIDRLHDSDNVSKLKEHLKQCLSSDGKYWSDLEEAMGKYTVEFDSYSELEETYDDINDEMQRYIGAIDKRELPTGIDSELLKRNLSNPQSFLTPAEQETINSLYLHVSRDAHFISIVNFNYTTTIEKLLKFSGKAIDLVPAAYDRDYMTKLTNIYHIHGNSKQPLLGINDASQIFNENLRSDVDVQDYLIKPKMNSALGSLIDCRTKQSIINARLICVYGLSLGSTDAIWWELIGEQIRQGAIAILYVFDNNAHGLTPRKMGRYKRFWKSKICDVAKIQNAQRESIMNRIIIAPNTPIFNIKS